MKGKNILLFTNGWNISLGDLLELHLDYNVTPVTSLDNVSINSYDAFIVSLLLFQRDGEKKFESDLNKLLNTGKSVVLTFDERIDRKTPGLVVSGATPLNMTPMGNIHNVRKINFPKSNTEIEPIEKKEIISLEYLERSYGIKFKKRECNSNIIDRINELFEYINIDIELAYVMNDTQNKFDKFVSLKHTKDYFILKNKNLIIMHDVDANFSYSYRKIDDFKNKFTISDEISNLLTPFFEFLFTYKDKSKTPDWIKDVQFFEEEKILTEIEKINNEITLLQNKKNVVELDL